MNDRLFVYDASAGSGKTYNLAERFSDYLIEEHRKGRSDAHRRVVAVTFTNKATFEMKSEIIKKLYKRSTDPSYEYRKDAGTVLRELVHDYTMFRVSTIDSFFQKVLRAFALELGSSSSYDTSLDSQSAVEAALDGVYSKLDSDKKLLGVMEKISLSRLEEGKYWNWRDELLKICGHVLSPDYQNFKPSQEEVSLSSFTSLVASRLKELEKTFVNQVISLDDFLTSCFSQYDLDRLGIADAFRKFLRGRRVKNKPYLDRSRNKITGPYPEWIDRWINNPESLLLKKGTQADLDEVRRVEEGRMEAIKSLYDKYYGEYLTLSVISRYIRETSLLDYVSKELDDYLSSHQLTLLSNAPKILSDLIDGSDTPFVYDKIGVATDHYLLDEFQDTSVEQWNNFKPLIKESIASGNQSLLVGDVKQSIYRWRGGDWSLLKDAVKADFDQYYYKKPLDVNHRSLQNIVNFNNLLFSSEDRQRWFENQESAPAGFLVRCFMENLLGKTGNPLLSKEIYDIYEKSAQHVKPEFADIEQKGVVHVVSCGAMSKGSLMSKTDFILWDVARRIRRLVSSGLGYGLKDIAVLTSTGKEASLVANYLVNRGISIISGESLQLESNKIVSVILEILKKMVNPEDKGLDVMLRISGVELTNTQYLSEQSEHYVSFSSEVKSCTSLYQICKLVIRTFFKNLDQGDVAFVKAFLDRVLDYSASEGTSISAFLKWWGTAGKKFFIPEPSEGNAVRIMTMHKAKGLAFRVVFIPFLRDEMISSKTSDKWLRTDKVGYTGPLLLPMSSRLEGSFYSEELDKERMEQSVDSLNLAYVSFTRPRERLYIYAKNLPSKDGKLSTISSALNLFCSQNCSQGQLFTSENETIDLQTVKKEDPDISLSEEKEAFEITDYRIGQDGELSYGSLKDKKDGQGSPCRGSDAVTLLMQDASGASLKSGYEDDDIMKGIQYHELFSYIDEMGDEASGIGEKVRRAVDKFLKKNPGSLLGDNAGDIADEVLGKITGVSVYGWFDSQNRILSEKSIISPEGTFRPDRVILPQEGKGWAVVVDYKFGSYEKDSSKNKSYHRQVRKYMKLLSRMGFEDVKGYLWHVMAGVVEQVGL